MIKFFRHIRRSLINQNKGFCHSALDAESKMKSKFKNRFLPVYPERRRRSGMTKDYKIMIKFFRKIRQKLLSENKFSKYLLYAVGEIILVVIGIMIALEFNNRNEQNKHIEGINETITAIEEDLVFNFKDVTYTLNFYKTQDTILKKVLNKQYSIEDYRTNDLISIVTANWRVHTPKTENLNTLLNKEEYATNELIPIINAVKRLITGKNIADQAWETLYNNIDKNTETLTQQVSLVKLDSISLEQRYAYLLSDPDYQHIAELNWIRTQDFYDLLSRFRADNIALLSTIKMVRENYGRQELEHLYDSLGMKPFKEVDCKTQNITNNNELRRGYLIGNLSDKEITIKVMNDGKVGDLKTLKPNEFRDSRPEYAGLNGDYTIIVEQIDQNGTCINKYVAVNKGYLLIE